MLVSVGYVGHGGHGLPGYNWTQALDMPVRDLIWVINWLNDQREAEAKAISAARGKK